MSTFLCFLIKFPVQTFNKLGMINSAPCSPTAKLTNMAILLNRSPARVNKQHPTNIFGYFFKYQKQNLARKKKITNSKFTPKLLCLSVQMFSSSLPPKKFVTTEQSGAVAKFQINSILPGLDNSIKDQNTSAVKNFLFTKHFHRQPSTQSKFNISNIDNFVPSFVDWCQYNVFRFSVVPVPVSRQSLRITSTVSMQPWNIPLSSHTYSFT